MELNQGDPTPSFRAKNQDGLWLSSADFQQHVYLLFFYPKDGTDACTQEVCELRDIHDYLDSFKVKLIGISPDGERSHKLFQAEHNLPFPLLCDESFEISSKFGVLQRKKKNGKHYVAFERTTFLINEEGAIQWLERPVVVEGHADRVLNALKNYFSCLTPPA